MNVTIIHNPDCPLCERAIQEFTGDGHEVELYGDLTEIADIGRKVGMMTDLLRHDGDKDAFPQVFIYDRFVPWRPKGKKGA